MRKQPGKSIMWAKILPFLCSNGYRPLARLSAGRARSLSCQRRRSRLISGSILTHGRIWSRLVRAFAAYRNIVSRSGRMRRSDAQSSGNALTHLLSLIHRNSTMQRKMRHWRSKGNLLFGSVARTLLLPDALLLVFLDIDLQAVLAQDLLSEIEREAVSVVELES